MDLDQPPCLPMTASWEYLNIQIGRRSLRVKRKSFESDTNHCGSALNKLQIVVGRRLPRRRHVSGRCLLFRYVVATCLIPKKGACGRWRASPSRIALTRSRIASIWCCSRASRTADLLRPEYSRRAGQGQESRRGAARNREKALSPRFAGRLHSFAAASCRGRRARERDGSGAHDGHRVDLSGDAQFDRMTEEDLLRGLEGLCLRPRSRTKANNPAPALSAGEYIAVALTSAPPRLGCAARSTVAPRIAAVGSFCPITVERG